MSWHPKFEGGNKASSIILLSLFTKIYKDHNFITIEIKTAVRGEQ